MVVVIFGVSGAGKTTIGKLMAERLHWVFKDADDFHPPENVAKMRQGIPLNDHDREPWLTRLREEIAHSLQTNQNTVVACSALKRVYRDVLRANAEVKFVFLRGDRNRIAEQLKSRSGHFMNPDLLESQFADLEEPEAAESAMVVDLASSPEHVVEEILRRLAHVRL